MTIPVQFPPADLTQSILTHLPKHRTPQHLGLAIDNFCQVAIRIVLLVASYFALILTSIFSSCFPKLDEWQKIFSEFLEKDHFQEIKSRLYHVPRETLLASPCNSETFANLYDDFCLKLSQVLCCCRKQPSQSLPSKSSLKNTNAHHKSKDSHSPSPPPALFVTQASTSSLSLAAGQTPPPPPLTEHPHSPLYENGYDASSSNLSPRSTASSGSEEDQVGKLDFEDSSDEDETGQTSESGSASSSGTSNQTTTEKAAKNPRNIKQHVSRQSFRLPASNTKYTMNSLSRIVEKNSRQAEAYLIQSAENRLQRKRDKKTLTAYEKKVLEKAPPYNEPSVRNESLKRIGEVYKLGPLLKQGNVLPKKANLKRYQDILTRYQAAYKHYCETSYVPNEQACKQELELLLTQMGRAAANGKKWPDLNKVSSFQEAYLLLKEATRDQVNGGL